MATTKDMTAEEIRAKGMEALTQALGVSGTIRFLQLFSNGQGDYTAERQQLQDDVTLPEIVAEIKRMREAGQLPR